MRNAEVKRCDPFAFSLQPSAFSLQPFAFSLPPSSFRLQQKGPSHPRALDIVPLGAGSGGRVRAFVRANSFRHLVLQAKFSLLQCLFFDFLICAYFVLRNKFIQPALTLMMLFDPLPELRVL